MKKPVVMMGVGEMGGVFSRGLLKNGYPVYPLNRNTEDLEEFLSKSDWEAIFVSVGEKDLEGALKSIPDDCKDKLILLQNELLPSHWKMHNINEPTIISVWFEKKFPRDYKVIIPSVVYGPKAALVSDSLKCLNIPTKILKSSDELLGELIIKNLYILTTNIAGLEVGGNVGDLWANHQPLAAQVVDNILDIQFILAGQELDRQVLIKGMLEAFKGDPEHKCTGRSALNRLDRTIMCADQYGLAIEKLRKIKKNLKS